jgi:hypothetical protein
MSTQISVKGLKRGFELTWAGESYRTAGGEPREPAAPAFCLTDPVGMIEIYDSSWPPGPSGMPVFHGQPGQRRRIG